MKTNNDFDKEMNKCFEFAESLEDLLNNKIKAQEKDHQNPKHIDDIRKVNELLSVVASLLGK